MFKVDFSFVDHVQLSSQFTHKGQLRTAELLQPTQKTDILRRAPELFAQLAVQKVPVSMIDAFALMGWPDADWHSADGQRAMQHWWQSALDQPILQWVMTLRVVMADSERWPGPRPVVAAMSAELQRLIEQGVVRHNAKLVLALAQQNAKAVAKLAFDQACSVAALMQSARFPLHLPIVAEAEQEWLECWLAAPVEKRLATAPVLQQLLQPAHLSRQQQLAKVVLNSAVFPQKLDKLKNRVGDYPELVKWFAHCVRNIDFKQGFSVDEARRVTCWVGSGNYEAFRKMIDDFVDAADKKINGIAQKNRYLFWADYQFSFEGCWFLLPNMEYEKYFLQYDATKIKLLEDYAYPVGVFKIGKYYIVQSFMVTGGEADLIIIQDDSSYLYDYLNAKNRVEYKNLTQNRLCLIHDQLWAWQTDLVVTLKDNFNINPDDIFVTQNKQLARKDFNIADRLKNLQNWLNSEQRNVRQRYSDDELWNYALSAKRHGLLEDPAVRLARQARERAAAEERKRLAALERERLEAIEKEKLLVELERLAALERALERERFATIAREKNAVWTDLKTGMMWMRPNLGQTWDGTTAQGEAKKYTWNDALKAVADLNKNGGFAGYTDWQLPDIDTLKTMMVTGKAGYGCPDGVLFQPEKNNWGWFWSSSPEHSGGAWGVNFGDGKPYGGYSGNGNPIRLVRAASERERLEAIEQERLAALERERLAAQAHEQRLASSADGTWTDPKTGMMWMRHSLGQTWDGTMAQGEAKKYTWNDALKAVADLNKNGGFAGYTDWQLPHIEDLASLLRSSTGFRSICEIPAKNGGTVTVPNSANDGHQKPTIDQAVFPNTPSYVYWSASPVAYYSLLAWGVYFNNGYSYYYSKNNSFLVRAVRRCWVA